MWASRGQATLAHLWFYTGGDNFPRYLDLKCFLDIFFFLKNLLFLIMPLKLGFPERKHRWNLVPRVSLILDSAKSFQKQNKTNKKPTKTLESPFCFSKVRLKPHWLDFFPFTQWPFFSFFLSSFLPPSLSSLPPSLPPSIPSTSLSFFQALNARGFYLALWPNVADSCLPQTGLQQQKICPEKNWAGF